MTNFIAGPRARLFLYLIHPEMKRITTLLLLALFSLSSLESCKQSVATSSRNNAEPQLPAVSVEENPQMYAVLYQQTAAEYRALCYQAFNIARIQLDRLVKETHNMKTNSVIVDIDETMLDNSPYEARCILDGTSYPEGWDEWVNEGSARAVPGALDFLRYAQSQGVRVFYISNRKERNLDVTLDNMKKLGFPFAQQDHMYLKRDESSKKTRRAQVEDRTNVLMLIGDNLADFSDLFERTTLEQRNQLTDKFRNDFGSRFIVIPNAIYGDWLMALYADNPEASPEEKSEMRKKALLTK